MLTDEDDSGARTAEPSASVVHGDEGSCVSCSRLARGKASTGRAEGHAGYRPVGRITLIWQHDDIEV